MWVGLLVAITMAIHGTGMFAILQFTDSLKERFEPMESFLGGVGWIILASLLILLTNVLEVRVWMVFFFLQGAQANHSVASYNVLLNYTTLQAGYLPQRWHLLDARGAFRAKRAHRQHCAVQPARIASSVWPPSAAALPRLLRLRVCGTAAWAAPSR